VLHPVGRLPARVYWRRRLILLVVLIGLLAGGGWLALRLLDPPGVGSTAGAATSSSAPPTPALERVLPSLAGVRTPDTAPGTPGPETRRRPTPTAAGPTPGSPCTDEMIDLQLRAPTQVPAGSEVTVELVVRNVSEVPCVRRLDAELQEVRLADGDGNRIWGSNDCLQEGGERSGTLRPGEDVVLPVVWSGRTSEPTCTRARTTPEPGVYLLRGRLDEEITPIRRIRLT
jgi:hypothetical protein